MRLVALGADDQAFDLLWQLVRIPHGPAGAIIQGLLAVLFVAIEDLVAGFARDAEVAAQGRHGLTLQQARATKHRRSSTGVLSFHGIDTSRRKGRKV
jgi:hypothetical protein